MADEFETIDLADLRIGDDTELEFQALDFDVIAEERASETRTRYIKPRFNRTAARVHYSNAVDAARAVSLTSGERQHFIVSGSFIFGDLIEALLVEKNARALECCISTLSLSQENVDSMAGLLRDGYIDRLVLCFSNYFYSHERRGLVPYLLERLDIDDRTDIAVTRTHMKIVLIDVGGHKIVITGSANLRASNSVEQFCIEDSQELYEFYRGWIAERVENYGIIDHAVEKGADNVTSDRNGSDPEHVEKRDQVGAEGWGNAAPAVDNRLGYSVLRGEE